MNKIARRALIWTPILISIVYLYWDRLVVSLDGSKPTAALILFMAWVCGIIDMNDMTGQPHED